MLRKLGVTAREGLVLGDWLPLLGPYTLNYKVGMEVACVTLRLSLRKGVYVGHKQWDIMIRSPTDWANLHGSGVLEMVDYIYAVYMKKVTETACDTFGPRFGKFTRGSKLQMGVINNQDFVVASKKEKSLLTGWEK